MDYPRDSADVASSTLPRFGLGNLGLVSAALLCGSCDGYRPLEPRVEEFNFGVDVDLGSAVHMPDDQTYAAGGASFVVGAKGATWDLPGPVRDIARVGSRFVAVGDNGLVGIASYEEAGLQAFQLEPSAVNADLVAVAGFEPFGELAIIAVGDGVVLVGRGTPEEGPLVWTEADVPSGGWGSLRDIRVSSPDVCVLGDAGALFCSDLPELAWNRVSLDTDANLVRFCEGLEWEAVGKQGTLVSPSGADVSAWQSTQVTEVDLLACSNVFSNAPVVVGADRTLYEVVGPTAVRPLVELTWQPLGFDSQTGYVIVGEAGHGATLLGVGPA